MNHLAHLWLAGSDDQAMVGAVAADFCRGALDPDWPASLRAGVLLHRRIDGWTDTHALQTQARALFEPPYRRCAGIALDVWFDHLLARDFERWTGVTLRAFCDRAYAVLLAGDDARLPPSHHVFVSRLAKRDGLHAYVDEEHLDYVYNILARQLAHGRSTRRVAAFDALAGMLPVMQALERPLSRLFAEFWPALVDFARTTRATLGLPSS